MKKVGLIVMGSAENRAAYQDMIDAFGTEIDVTLIGVLDGFRRERVEEIYSYEEGENYIVTPVPWRDHAVRISARKARREVCRIAAALYAQGVNSVLVVCSGAFDRPEETPGLFCVPEEMMLGLLNGLHPARVGFIVPRGSQKEESALLRSQPGAIVRTASPYGSWQELEQAAEAFRDEDVDLIVADCMAFTPEMGRLMAERSGKQVLLPRQLLPKLLRGMLTLD